MPDRTIRPSISPVDNTRKPSSCRSGQRSISVSSMCTRAELHPRNAVRVHIEDRKSTRLNSSHVSNSYAVFRLKKKKLERANAHTDVRRFAGHDVLVG